MSNEPQLPNLKPTAEMVVFFERRTREHIERVRMFMNVMAAVTPYGDELRQRGNEHDASKFSEAEYVPYVWLTEYHRCRRGGESFCYPAGMEEQIAGAIEHHMKHNRHHPEYHADPNDMSDTDLIEMVCDWTAMAHEFSEMGRSARGWADRNVGHRYQFKSDRAAYIYQMIELLDENLEKSERL